MGEKLEKKKKKFQDKIRIEAHHLDGNLGCGTLRPMLIKRNIGKERKTQPVRGTISVAQLGKLGHSAVAVAVAAVVVVWGSGEGRPGRGAGAAGGGAARPGCCCVTGTCGAAGWAGRCSAGTGPSGRPAAGGCC